MGNNDNKALDLLINKILYMVEAKNEKLRFDKTFVSTVWGENADGTYQISYLGQLYNVSNALGTRLQPGQSVWVKIPGGIFRNMHICGMNYKTRKNHNPGYKQTDPHLTKNAESIGSVTPETLDFTGFSADGQSV